MTTELGMPTILKTSFEQATEKATQALKAEGFDMLTEIDVKSTMKKAGCGIPVI